MQKTRRLMDKNSVSFQLFLLLSSFIAVGSESQISVYQVTLYFEILSYLARGEKIIKLASKIA